MSDVAKLTDNEINSVSDSGDEGKTHDELKEESSEFIFKDDKELDILEKQIINEMES